MAEQFEKVELRTDPSALCTRLFGVPSETQIAAQNQQIEFGIQQSSHILERDEINIRGRFNGGAQEDKLDTAREAHRTYVEDQNSKRLVFDPRARRDLIVGMRDSVAFARAELNKTGGEIRHLREFENGSVSSRKRSASLRV